MNGDVTEPIYEENGFKDTEDSLDFEKMLIPLNDKQRELIILRFAQELTFKEMAEVTGSRLRTVQTEVRRALVKIERFARKEK